MIQFQHSKDHKLNSEVENIETRQISLFFFNFFFRSNYRNFYTEIGTVQTSFSFGSLCGLVWSAISNES